MENQELETVTFQPLRNQVLIKLHTPKDTTDSGIFIPSSLQDAPITGLVMAVGPGTKTKPMELKVGDSILFGQYSGNNIKIEERDYVLIIQDNVFGIIEENK